MLAGQLVFNAVATLATTAGGFVSSILVAHILGVQGTGVVAYGIWLITVAVVIADIGVPGAMMRYLPELAGRSAGEERGAGLARALFRSFALAVVTVSFGFFIYAAWLVLTGGSQPQAVVADDGSSALFWALAGATAVAQSLAAFVFGYLKGRQQFARLAGLSAAAGATQVVATWQLACRFGAEGALGGMIVGSLVPLCMLPPIVFGRPYWPGDLRRRVRQYAAHTWLGYLVAAFAWSRMEIFFLQRSWGSEAVSLFSVSLTLSNLATYGPLLLAGALLPHFARLADADDRVRMHDLYAASLRLVALFVMPACLGLAATAPVVVPLLYGAAFEAAAPSTAILVAAGAISGTASIAITYLYAREHTGFVLWTGAAGAVLSVAVGLVLVPSVGPLAAAGGRATIQVAIALAAIGYAWRSLATPAPVAALVRITLAAAGCACAAWLWTCVTTGQAMPLMAIPVGMLVYVLLVRLLGCLPEQDCRRLRAAAAHIPGARLPARLLLSLLSPVGSR